MYLTDQFLLCFYFQLATLNSYILFLHSQHSIFIDNLLHMLCLVFVFWYLKVHDDTDGDAFVTEPKPLKNISMSFVPDTIETVMSAKLLPLL